ncbi:MAG: hypothetical protein Q8O10_10330 [candidate division Zixibacteria bacterium]|nr:hypothetical protein [candidate division Zixibacteria bacterium]
MYIECNSITTPKSITYIKFLSFSESTITFIAPLDPVPGSSRGLLAYQLLEMNLHVYITLDIQQRSLLG